MNNEDLTCTPCRLGSHTLDSLYEGRCDCCGVDLDHFTVEEA